MKKDTLLKIAKYAVILLIFFFIFRYLYLDFSSINLREISFNSGFLLLSVLIYFIHLLFNALIWHIITLQNNCAINVFEAIKLRIYADFGKYIPGKVFSYGILLFSYEKKNIPKKSIAACSVQEFILSTLAAIIIALASIFFSGIQELEPYKYLFLGLAAGCFAFVYPPVLQFIMNVFFRIFKKEKITLTISFGRVLLTLLLFLCTWLIFGWAFYFFINSFYALSAEHYFFITGAFAIAGIIGFVSVFAPAGLGVREGVLIFTLSLVLTTALSSLISLISRLWMTLSEILLLLIVFVLDLIFRKRTLPKP